MICLKELARFLGNLWALPWLSLNVVLGVLQATFGLIADAPKLLAWKIIAVTCRHKRLRLERRQALRDSLPARRGL